MKTRIFPSLMLAVAGFALIELSARCGAAENPPVAVAAPNPAGAAAPSQANPVALSYGVQDILNLAVAHISDDVIVPFVEASGRIYNLSAPEIIYLREKGVSDRVLTAMLSQRPKVKAKVASESVATTAHVEAAASSTVASTRPAQTVSTVVQAAPTYVTPPVVYAPATPAPAVYYGYPDYYAPRYDYSPWVPALSFAVGLGAGYYWGGYHGDHHGYYHGGGYHGGYHH